MPVPPDRPSRSRNVLKEPASALTSPESGPFPFRVMTLITPPMESDPYSVLCGPRRTSILSTFAAERCAKLNTRPAEDGSFTSTPSTRTSVCSLFVPRRKTLERDPGPPLRTASRPTTSRRASKTVRYCFCSISFRVITVIDDAAASAASSILDAVTTTSPALTVSSACEIRGTTMLTKPRTMKELFQITEILLFSFTRRNGLSPPAPVSWLAVRTYSPPLPPARKAGVVIDGFRPDHSCAAAPGSHGIPLGRPE